MSPSRFNKNGINLSPEQAEAMIDEDLVDTTPEDSKEESKVESEAPAPDETSIEVPETKEEPPKVEDEKSKRKQPRRGLRRSKKGE